ncbi:MAG: ferredoxin family protein [candidate division WOR-3 bacterium]
MTMPWLAGIPRREVEWFPTIDRQRCVKCGMCMNCGRSVYEWTDEGPVVARPYDCVVGCSTCANLCQGMCITFQPVESVRELYRKHGVWKKVKDALRAEGKLGAKPS